MDFNTVRLALAVGWLAAAAVGASRPAADSHLVALIAVGLAGWNFVRWYSVRSAAARPPAAGGRPLRRRGGPPDEGSNPELDFTKRDGG
jgi:hypothetical protein